MRTEGMGNKLILIVVLCAALGLFLYIRPKLFAPEPPPTLMDRLPDDEILGRFYLLDIARETSSMMYYHNIPIRDLLSYEFLLTQGKNFGLNIQQPGYFFADKDGEWGTFLSVSDSSRIPSGIMRLKQYIQIEDTLVFERNAHYLPDQNIYLFYDKTYLFVYHGDDFLNRVKHTMYAKRGEIEESWKMFTQLKTFKDEKLVVFSNSENVKKYGAKYVLFAHDTDSLSFKLKGYIRASEPHNIKLKPVGIAFQPKANMQRMLDLHLDLSEFKKAKGHPLYKWVVSMGKKIGFPTELFFQTWNGDLCYQEGGVQMIDEEIVETVYDEEFNLTEVKSTRKVPVPGFAVLTSTVPENKALINKLFAKGIITKQNDNRYRFLFSPPLRLQVLPSFINVYSGDYSPKLTTSSSCSGLWNYRGTKVAFQVDSLNKMEVFGSMQFPVNRLLRRGKFF